MKKFQSLKEEKSSTHLPSEWNFFNARNCKSRQFIPNKYQT